MSFGGVARVGIFVGTGEECVEGCIVGHCFGVDVVKW